MLCKNLPLHGFVPPWEKWVWGGGLVISYIKLTHHQTAKRHECPRGRRCVKGAWYVLLSHDAVI